MIAEHRPRFSAAEAEQIAAAHFGIHAAASELPSDRDQNFALESPGRARFVLKISSSTASAERIRFENRLIRIADRVLETVQIPVPIPTSEGADMVRLEKDGDTYLTRLLRWVEGMPLASFRPHTPELFFEIGGCLGRLSNGFRTVAEEGRSNSPEWDLSQAPRTIASLLEHVTHEEHRRMVDAFLNRFAVKTQTRLQELPHQVTFNDANDHNLLVSPGGDGTPRLRGLIDFGDAAAGMRIGDLAIACAYGMLGKTDPIAAAEALTSGFHSECPILESEAEVLFDLIRLRLCLSAALSSKRAAEEPENDYAVISSKPVWSLLEQLTSIHPRLARYRLRDACGLEPVPHAKRIRNWLAAPGRNFGQVCDKDLRHGRLTVFDLSPGSTDPVTGADETTASQMIFARLETESSEAGIGRYDEPRLVYRGPQFEIETWRGRQFRTLHLGIDVFLPPGAPIYAALEGRVHHLYTDEIQQGYGVAVILEHSPADCPSFFTLYGHLSRIDVDRLSVGDPLGRGQLVGHVGPPAENGGWTPHLHFQIVTDLLDSDHGFPGVAHADQRSVWISLSPDPNLIIGIPEELLSEVHLSPAGIQERRARLIGPSLSTSYDRPLNIVRGIGTTLFDSAGREYLDCVNNVSHVGHGHPAVVRAAADQMRVLNTNTRYLHENLVRYAERLTSKLPDTLRTCFFVNSGSEANDLAIRLARQHTGRKGVVVFEGAYHGHLSSLIRISPYKFDGPGGGGKPEDVFVAPMPDAYRGLHRGTDAATAYAADFRSTVEQAVASGGACSFLFESMLSCGGQIDPPGGFLASACQSAREAGLLCIADEVQVGFGRTGEHFWGFERHKVTPDIVTMGKPIGNGHPLGAVVTRPEIAESFATGMEYFNTYGGNPVSCAAGLAVLDVIEDEGLQERARLVGGRLKERLLDVAARHPIVGDVRGVGLFLGIEFVSDPESRQPAPRLASYLVNRARELGVLLSTDGPERNVIKIKPPLVFGVSDADRLVGALDQILNETPCTL